MDPKAQFVFFLLALVCFVVAAVKDGWAGDPGKSGQRPWVLVNLVALGLALVDFVWMWTAYKSM